MKPSTLHLRLLLFPLGLALALAISRITASHAGIIGSASIEILYSLWVGSLVVYLLVAIADGLRNRNLDRLEVLRTLAHTIPVGVDSPVAITIRNPYAFRIDGWLYDDYPDNVDVPGLPVRLSVPPESEQSIEYTLFPDTRGDAAFGNTTLLVTSRWGLWERKHIFKHPARAKIYPNFAAVSQLANLGFDRKIARLGIHLQQRRGDGLDFHQLREFREGDAMRQIDWKATARYQKPISREYQDERDQDVVFLLDCSRQLRHKHAQLSFFDHALNALLVTAHIALRQGDAVGFMSFSGIERWQAPVKGSGSINQLLNQLYDLHSTTEPSDYLKAAQRLLTAHRKHSLIIFITNIQDEANDELKAAVALLRKSHKVLIASLRDNSIELLACNKIHQLEDALNYCGTVGFLLQRKRLLAELQLSGLSIIDSYPENLHIGLAQEYLRIKRSGNL